MADAPGSVWLIQASADHRTANRLLDRKEPWLFCQIVSKLQQSVEKSVKGIVASLQEAGVLAVPIGRRHDVERFFGALVHLPRRVENREIQTLIQGLLNENTRGEIRSLGALAPKWPVPGSPFPRNTEYPYQDPVDRTQWRAPSAEGSFNWERDVQRFLPLAGRILRQSQRIVGAIDRRPR
jgi:hypothetical protein